jgi:hypothetical protein
MASLSRQQTRLNSSFNFSRNYQPAATKKPVPGGHANYHSWKDAGLRQRPLPSLVQPSVASPRHNGFYGELVRQQQRASELENERRLALVADTNNNEDDDRPFTTSRYGGKGAPWRHLSVTTGVRGENVMFINGEVKAKDMSRFYPYSVDTIRSVDYWTPRGVALEPISNGGRGLSNTGSASPNGRRPSAAGLCAKCRCKLLDADAGPAPTPVAVH